MTMLFIFFILFGLCWGSFLNVVAYRLTFDKPFFTTRSACPSCKTTIAFYDNIPLISWIILKQHCRNCQAPISWIYPFTEAITCISITGLAIRQFDSNFSSINVPHHWAIFFSLFILISALIVATATDLYEMVIPQLVTVWLIPLGIGLSLLGFTDINVFDCIVGSFIGYLTLWLPAWIFKYMTKQQGIGEGDMELMAMIGSFLGVQGVWWALMIGSITGTIAGSAYLCIAQKNKKTHIPFGPFIALGAITFIFFEKYAPFYILGI